jgi:hypothetical protein
MALQAKEVLSCGFEAVADAGYYHGHEVKRCLEAGITPYMPRPIPSANKGRGLFEPRGLRLGGRHRYLPVSGGRGAYLPF